MKTQTIMRQLDKVIFRKFADGEIIALFPEIPGTNNFSTCLDYVHNGQHGSCNIRQVLDMTFKPSDIECKALASELAAIGYNLDIKQRYSSTMAANRLKLMAVPL